MGFSVFKKISEADAAQHNASKDDESDEAVELTSTPRRDQVDKTYNQRIAIEQRKDKEQRYAKSPHQATMAAQASTYPVKREVKNDQTKKGHEFNSVGVIDLPDARCPEPQSEIMRKQESHYVQRMGQSVCREAQKRIEQRHTSQAKVTEWLRAT